MYPLLNGLRVIEISAFVAVPFCGNTLARLGAEVILIDPPGGVDHKRRPLSDEGGSICWSGLNHAKRHMAADLRDPQAQERVIELLGDDGSSVQARRRNKAAAQTDAFGRAGKGHRESDGHRK